MDSMLPADRLLTIVKLQNEIAATALDLDSVMNLVVARARVIPARMPR